MSRDPLAVINPHINRALYDIVQTPWTVAERVILDYELLYVKEGRIHITIEDQVYEGKPGEIYLFRPGQRHSISVLEEGHCIQPHVHFDLLQYEDQDKWFCSYKNLDALTPEERALIRPDVMKELFPHFPSQIVLNDRKYAEFLLFDVIQHFQNERDPYREMQVKWSFLKFLTHLLKECGYTESKTEDSNRKLAAQVRMYLENNLHRAVRMSEVAAVFHMDASYLGRVFRLEYQTSPIRFHTTARIRKSHDMLLYTNAPVTDVAQRMGFATTNDFSRTFKRVMGYSPVQTRR